MLIIEFVSKNKDVDRYSFSNFLKIDKDLANSIMYKCKQLVESTDRLAGYSKEYIRVTNKETLSVFYIKTSEYNNYDSNFNSIN